MSASSGHAGPTDTPPDRGEQRLLAAGRERRISQRLPGQTILAPHKTAEDHDGIRERDARVEQCAQAMANAPLHRPDGPTRVMAALLRQGRDATGLRDWYATRDARRAPDEPCTCGSGRAFARCHGAPTS